MKIVILTSNCIRHKFFANSLARHADDALVVVESDKNDVPVHDPNKERSAIENHFYLRYCAEKEYFAGNDVLHADTLPLIQQELNLPYVYEVIKKFNPDAVFVFGSSIIREPLLSLPAPGRFINMHLGISPYYRGAATNFWPFVNKELEYVGATLLHIDAGVDTGDIIAHVRPNIEMGDTVHTIGCKTVQAGVAALGELLGEIRGGKELKRVKQWSVPDRRYYRKADFNEQILARYYENLRNGLIENYLKGDTRDIALIPLKG